MPHFYRASLLSALPEFKYSEGREAIPFTTLLVRYDAKIQSSVANKIVHMVLVCLCWCMCECMHVCVIYLQLSNSITQPADLTTVVNQMNAALDDPVVCKLPQYFN